jgi:hypothetical protein
VLHAAVAAGWGAHLVQLLPAHGLQGQQRQVAAVQRGQRQRIHHLRTVELWLAFSSHGHGAFRMRAVAASAWSCMGLDVEQEVHNYVIAQCH